MLTSLNDWLERVVGWCLAGLFAGLILVVFVQVLARNVLEVPMIWTLDMAQLLFSWCIFLGAAVAWRRKAHFEVDLWPDAGALSLIPKAAALLATAAVVYLLTRYGLSMTSIAALRESQSLGITELWFFLPIPIGGALIALFLVEEVGASLQGDGGPGPRTETGSEG